MADLVIKTKRGVNKWVRSNFSTNAEVESFVECATIQRDYNGESYQDKELTEYGKKVWASHCTKKNLTLYRELKDLPPILFTDWFGKTRYQYTASPLSYIVGNASYSPFFKETLYDQIVKRCEM